MEHPFFALEIHDTTLWEPSRVLPMIRTMEQWGYNALVLHQNDLLDACTQLSLTANYGVSDLRLKKVRNRTAWLNTLVEALGRIDARLFLEIKEPSFHDYALELYPDLLGKDGQPDPRRPEWAAFCQAKVEDLLERVPGLGGLVVNLSSPESRVSLPDYLASTGDGQSQSDWFDRMLAAFRTPLDARGADLWIRDFSYTPDMQSEVLAAVERCGGRVGASVKITAHDYFPEFPENPVAADITAPLIFEFEAFGEHMGWGAVPNCRVEEFARRMQGYRERGAVGFLMRISWEAISGITALDSLSSVNVFALPKLVEADQDPQDLILAWLSDAYGCDGPVAVQVADLLLQSWHVLAAIYWDGQVFPRHSCLPSSWQEGWLSMDTSGMGRRDWMVEIDPSDPRLTDAAGEALFAAKEKATATARVLAQLARSLVPDLPEELSQDISAFHWLPDIAIQFELATKATYFRARNETGKMQAEATKLLEMADDLESRLTDADPMPYHRKILLDPAQIRLFVKSLEA